MPRLIDADALIEEHCKGCSPEIQEGCKTDPVCASMMWVVDAPTIDPASLRPTGEWILEHETYGKMICSRCKQEALHEERPDPWQRGLLALFYVTSNYCPNCGAKMKGENDDQKRDT